MELSPNQANLLGVPGVRLYYRPTPTWRWLLHKGSPIQFDPYFIFPESYMDRRRFKRQLAAVHDEWNAKPFSLMTVGILASTCSYIV